MRCSSIMVALLAALVGVLGGTFVGSAQEATPAGQAAQPIVPAPNQCTVTPREIAFFQAIAGTPDAASPVAAPPVAATPVAGPEGEEADRDVRIGVLDTVRQNLACINAGNVLARLALYTDAAVAALVASGGGPMGDELTPVDGDLDALLAILGAEPTQLEGDKAALLAILDVRIQADGRVAVLVDIFDPVATTPGPIRVLYTMVEQNGRYLIDAEASEPITESEVGTLAA